MHCMPDSWRLELQAVRLALPRRFHLAAVVGDDEAIRLDPASVTPRTAFWDRRFEAGSPVF